MDWWCSSLENLRMYLPPFAPDYSGVCSTLFELNGIVVIHDAGGCTGNYTGYDEPRWYGSKSAIFCSKLREMDAVLGLDNDLIEKIKNTCTPETKFAAVLGSPVPMLIGSDMNGIAAELESQINIPCIGLDTNGFNLYNKGISMAEKALAEIFVKDTNIKVQNGVNILGMTPIDFGLNENASDLKEILKCWGYDIIASFSMGVTLDDIANASKAKVNVVVSQGGMALAKIMETKYKIPYVAGIPMGSIGAEFFKKAINNAIENNKSFVFGKDDYKIQSNDLAGKRILFIGEQIQGNSWRGAYNKIYQYDNVQVGCIFGKDSSISAEYDLDISTEDDIMNLLNNEEYDIIIADPLIKQLIPKEKLNNTKFISLPHVAVSSKLYWDNIPLFVGDNMNKYLLD